MSLFLLATRLYAQERSSSPAAEKLFREGQALLKNGDYEHGCPKLAESKQIEPAVGTLALLAYCHENQGKTASAWQEYLEVASMARNAGLKQQEAVARQRAAALEPHLSTLTIEVAAPLPGLQVSRGGEAVVGAELGAAVPVNPGRIRVEASADGYETFTTDVDVGANAAKISVTIPALKKLVATAPPVEPARPVAAPLPTETPRATSGGTHRALAYTALGVGVVGIAVGSVFGMQAKSKNDDSKDLCQGGNLCNAEGLDLRNQAKSSATVSTVAFGVGIAGAATGVVLLVSQPSRRSAAARVEPALGPGAAGVSVTGRF